MRYRISDHAAIELLWRSIPRPFLDEVMRNPQQIVPAEGGRVAYQSKLDFGNGRIMLMRAIVDDKLDPPVVVTVYRTSKVDKYWSEP